MSKGSADGLSLASPPLGTPWVRLKLSAFLGNLRNLSRELLPNVYSQAVLFITFFMHFLLNNIIFARAFLQTVTITGNSKNLYTCCTNKTALFK